MTKLNAFCKGFMAILTGENDETKSKKAWRQAEAALKVQIAALNAGLLNKEDQLERANESLIKARVNEGCEIEDRDQYIISLIRAKENCIKCEKELDSHKKTIAFLEDEYNALKAE